MHFHTSLADPSRFDSPGASSLFGLFAEVRFIIGLSIHVTDSHLAQNGPIHISSNGSLFENPYAWTTVADYVWIDQPVYVAFIFALAGLTDMSQWDWI